MPANGYVGYLMEDLLDIYRDMGFFVFSDPEFRMGLEDMALISG